MRLCADQRVPPGTERPTVSLLNTRSWFHERGRTLASWQKVCRASRVRGYRLRGRPKSDTCWADLSPGFAPQTRRNKLCRDTLVTMVKTADLWNSHDSTGGRC